MVDERKDRVAIISGTRNCYTNMMAFTTSLLDHGGVDKILFLIEDDIYPYFVPENIEIYNVSDQPYFRPDGRNMHCRCSWMVLMRVAYAKMFPQYDEVLILDWDMVVKKGIDELFDYDISDYYVAGVIEPNKSRDGRKYINAGVHLQNLKKWREDGLADRLIHQLNEARYENAEQDVINQFCEDKILALPSKFNASRFTAQVASPEDIVIRHYAAHEPGFDQDRRKYLDLMMKKNLELAKQAAMDGAVDRNIAKKIQWE